MIPQAGRATLAATLALWILMGVVRGAAAQDLVADLSDHVIEITTAFTGADVLLYGTIDAPGDVVLVVSGPAERVTVRRKEPMLGVWINSSSLTFRSVPSFYVAASNRPFTAIAEPGMLTRAAIGLDHLSFIVEDAEGLTADMLAEFRTALVRTRVAAGLYGLRPGAISFLGERLFRADLHLPAELPTGPYTVTVFLFRDGEVVSAQTVPLIVQQSGLSARIADVAIRRPYFYAVAAVAIALLAGWLAGVLFRR